MQIRKHIINVCCPTNIKMLDVIVTEFFKYAIDIIIRINEFSNDLFEFEVASITECIGRWQYRQTF